MSPKNPDPASPEKGRPNSPRPGRGAEAETGELTPMVRTTISLLIFIHCFFVLAAVAANYAPVSPLRNRLRHVFLRFYPEAIDQYFAYNIHLTYGEMADVDHEVVLQLPPAEGQTEPAVVTLPEPTLEPGIRRRRYQQLAYYLAQSSEDDVTGALLPRAIGSRLMSEKGVEEVTLRCRAHLLQDMEDLASDDQSRSDPYSSRYYRNLYEARVWRDGDNVELYKIEERSDTAPVANPGPIEAGDDLPGRFPGAP